MAHQIPIAGIVIRFAGSKFLYFAETEDWGKVLNFKYEDDLICMKTKEWTPLEPGEVEHKFYCSDGNNGELVLIEELKGKTVIVELIDTDVASPGLPAGPPGPIPNCE